MQQSVTGGELTPETRRKETKDHRRLQHMHQRKILRKVCRENPVVVIFTEKTLKAAHQRTWKWSGGLQSRESTQVHHEVTRHESVLVVRNVQENSCFEFPSNTHTHTKREENLHSHQ